MPTRDPEKNKQYVAKHRAMMKANEETKKEYNKLNASYYAKHASQLKEKLGTDEYNKEKAEYMRQYRANQKQGLMMYNVLNNLFEKPYPIVKRPVGRPKKPRNPVGRPRK